MWLSGYQWAPLRGNNALMRAHQFPHQWTSKMNKPWLTALSWLRYPQSPAQYQPALAPLGCPNRCDPSSQCTVVTRPTNGQRWWWGALVHIRLNPSHYKNTLKNKRLFGQSQSPVAWGSSICLPRLSLLYSSPFRVSDSSLPPCSTGSNIKRPITIWFPVQGQCMQLQQPVALDYDNSNWCKDVKKKKWCKDERVEQGVGRSQCAKHSVKENNHQYLKVQTTDQMWLWLKLRPLQSGCFSHKKMKSKN